MLHSSTAFLCLAAALVLSLRRVAMHVLFGVVAVFFLFDLAVDLLGLSRLLRSGMGGLHDTYYVVSHPQYLLSTALLWAAIATVIWLLERHDALLAATLLAFGFWGSLLPATVPVLLAALISHLVSRDGFAPQGAFEIISQANIFLGILGTAALALLFVQLGWSAVALLRHQRS